MPLIWKDCLGREWLCKITLGFVDDIRAATDLDLLTIADEEGALYKRIVGNVATFSNVMYHLAKLNGGQAFAATTEREFKGGIDGDTIDRMETAFREALSDFFPAEKREILKEGWTLETAYRTKMLERAKKTLRNTNVDALVEDQGAKMDQAVQAAFRSGDSSAKSPAPSSLIQSP